MKSIKLSTFILMAASVMPLGGCMAWTDGMDTASGVIYTDYNPFGSAYFGPNDYYGYNNYPYGGPMLPPPASRPIFGYPSWGGSISRPNAGPVTRPWQPVPGNRPGSGGATERPSDNGQRPGANVTITPSQSQNGSAGGAASGGSRPNNTSTRR